MKREKIYIYGKRAVTEALTASPRSLAKLFLGKGFSDPFIEKKIKEHRIPTSEMKANTAARVPGKNLAQKIIGVVNPGALVGGSEEFLKALKPNPDTLLVYLDRLHDPMNVGAVIRSAAAFGASAMLIPAQGQAPLSGSVIKASAGIAFRVPLVSVPHGGRVLRELKARGFAIYGLAMKGARAVQAEEFPRPTVLIVGNEGSGVGKEIFSFCDATLGIPMRPGVESLNAAVSASIAMHAWSLRHPKALNRK